MARPPAEELTDRELEVMHAAWRLARPPGDARPGDAPPGGAAELLAESDAGAAGGTGGGGPTVMELRDALAAGGRALAPTTVATLVKILCDKGFLERLPGRRPHRYGPVRGFEEVSRNLVGELVRKVFGGSRAALLARLVGEELSAAERELLRGVLDGEADDREKEDAAGEGSDD